MIMGGRAGDDAIPLRLRRTEAGADETRLIWEGDCYEVESYLMGANR
jgi:hypothetical protein